MKKLNLRFNQITRDPGKQAESCFVESAPVIPRLVVSFTEDLIQPEEVHSTVFPVVFPTPKKICWISTHLLTKVFDTYLRKLCTKMFYIHWGKRCRR